MFGVRFHTSVSRCTRGVNIQFLECDGRNEYEYILFLDTEGLQSPEYIDDDENICRDNRLATLAILPSDVTIILTMGESTSTISEILPIVLSIFLDSELAEKVIVNSLLENLKCIHQTKNLLAKEELTTNQINYGLYILYLTIHERMQHIQHKWDKEYGILSKFKKYKEMKKIVKNFGQGYEATEQFISTMDDWIHDNLSNTIIQQVIIEVANCLKNERWVAAPKAMQALLNKSILSHVKAKNYIQVISAIQNPIAHTKEN
ncbi:hypothetical protein THRCLA_10367 [Thraustotheca clavata]|uniref:VLIG-type G domain-containing protein n=1 Tax=Thraustotheca clavata TaxID=74557 RepID=A0A1V9YS23_9STRA|nr:hypothetical protein THRCLA_10367 [Thraustotheca clavata]